MSKQSILILILFLAALVTIQKEAVAVPADPTPIEYKQPDGSVITIRLKGDEKVSWAETPDGYTLLRNSKSGWEYAIKDEAGNLKISGVLAHKVGKRTTAELKLLKGLEKKARFSPAQTNKLKEAWEAKYKSSELEGTGSFYKTSTTKKKREDGLKSTEVFTPSGTKKLLMILIEYQDIKFTKTQAEFSGLMNTSGYTGNGAQGSVRDYFLETSYNQFDLTTTVAPHIYTAANNMAFYGADVTVGGVTNKYPEADSLMKEAIRAADADGVDFSQYDNDGDGSVDGVYVIFAGYSQATGGPTNAIWPHAGSISGVTCDGKTVSRYSCSNELTGGSGTNITTIGVICHEFGHVCGAPDYYDTDDADGGDFNGCGRWDVMDVGLYCGSPSGSRPAHFNPFEKIRADWVTPATLTSPTSITNMPDITSNPVVYQYNTTTADEYFLMENRQQTGFNTDVPGHGLLIYHYSKTVWDVSRNNAAPQGFYPVCASANTSPTTSSDAASYGDISTDGCPFPGSTEKTSFTDETTPSAKSWTGNNTFKPITDITENNTTKTIKFDFMVGEPCTPPTAQATNLTVTNIQENELTLNWTRGNGDNVIVLARRNSEINTTPLNGTAFNASSSFGAGDLIDAGTYVVYIGTESSVTLNDLLKNYTYSFAVYEYNTSGNCYLTPALTGSATTTGCSACVPTATSKGSFGITNVTINTINNSSDYSSSAYTNYAETLTELTAGTTYTLSVSTHSYSDQMVYTKAWIDWNNDCIFQTSEEYDLGSNINNGVVTKQILVPTNAYSGFVTMRIRTKFNSAPTPCGNMNNSEAEDYTLKITGGCTPPTIQASNFSVSNIQNEQATINWTSGNGDNVLVIARQGSAIDCNLVGATDFTANADFGAGAQIETGNYVVNNGTGNNVTVSGLLQNATYYFAVYEYNSTNCFLMPALTGSATTTGCSACVPTATTKGSFGITNVSFNTINNTSDFSASAYTNYTATTTNVTAGTTYTLSVSTSSYGGYSVYTKGWIDWNKDCTFQSSEEYDLGSNINVGIVTKQIQVPANAYSGYVTMRIRTTWNVAPTSCSNNNYSEAEDYSLKIVGGCTPPTAQATNFSATNIQNNQATINWVRGNGENVLVIARQGAAVDCYPIGATDFTANAQLGSGAQIGTDNYVVYNGAANNVTLTGLTPGATYYFAVYEYNSTSCILIPALIGNVTTVDEATWTGTTSTDWFTSSNWSTGSLPTAITSVAIPSAPANQPQISATGAVCKNITIDNGAILAMSATTAYTLSVNGDWTNNGGFTRGIGTVSFDNQTIDQTIGGSAQTNFNILKVNKGSISKILEATAVITLNATPINIILTAGVLKISSNSTITPITTSTTSTYLSINSSSGIWNNGGTINYPTAKQCNVTGLFRNTLGTANFSFLLASGTTNCITIEGGTVNVTGYLTASPTIYTQTGGTFNVSSTNTSSIPFNLNAASTFNMSGGVISIQKASNSLIEYQNLAGTSNVIGGTLQIGNTNTTGSPIIQINSTAPIWNLTVIATGTPTAQLETNPVTIKGDITIGSGTTLNANNLNISLAGNWTNDGTFTPGTGMVTFNGTSTQNFVGNATNMFNNLTVDNAVGLTTSGSTLTTVNGTLLINSGKKLTIGSGSKLTTTTLTNNSDATSLEIISDATGTGSLIYGSASGQATVQRYLTASAWHMIASPVSGETVGTFLTDNGTIAANPSNLSQHAFKSYDETNNAWNALLNDVSTDEIAVGNAYAVWPSSHGTASFSGTLQSGNKDVLVLKNGSGWNCIGNPYTSAIAINANAGTASGTDNFIYLNRNNINPSYAAIYVWEQENNKYSIISLNESPAFYAAVGQGFFVKVVNTGNINFTPALQTHQPTTAFKSEIMAWPEIKLTASLGELSRSASIKFNEDMKNGLDFGYDAGIMKTGFDVYTKLVEDNGVDFGIQCLPLDEKEEIIIPVGYETSEEGVLTLSAEISNLPSGYSASIEDRHLGTFTPLALNSNNLLLAVTANSKVDNRLFVHVAHTKNTLGVKAIADDLNVYNSNGLIYIAGKIDHNSTATLYDVQGRKIRTEKIKTGVQNTLPSSNLVDGVYLLHIQQQNGVISKRIVVNN